MTRFRIQSKIILGTFATDYLNQISCKKILKYFEKLKIPKTNTPAWEILVVKSHGDEEIDHDHFHFLLFWTGDKRPDIKNDQYFDIPIDSFVYMFEDNNNKREYYFQKDLNNELLNEYINSSKNFKLLKVAHPNIKPKNKKKVGSKEIGSTYDMFMYCWNQKIEYESNFDIDFKIQELKEEKEKEEKNNKKKKRENAREKLYSFVREQWLLGVNKSFVIQNIMEDEEMAFAYISTNAAQNFVEKQFKQVKPIQPIPLFGKYWVPNELAEYLSYLDNFVKLFHEEVIIPIKNKEFKNYTEAMESFSQKHKQRGKCCIIKGIGGIGKTHLLSCYGTCTYWKDSFNYDQWNNFGYFNFFDDLDVFPKKFNYQLNKEIANDFQFIKSWIGGQLECTFSGKYRASKTVYNGKPCLFVTNYDLSDRFSNEAIKYMKEIGVTFITLNEKLFEPKDTRTIGGFCKWREIDTTETYYYKNIYKKRLIEHQESDEEPPNKKQKNKEPEEIEEPLKENELLINSKYFKNLNIEFDPPRQGAYAITSNFNPSNNSFNGNISGLDGSNQCIAKKLYFNKIIENIKNKIHKYNKKFDILNIRIDELTKSKKKCNRKYNNTFKLFYIKKHYSNYSYKELEDIRFSLLNKINTIKNDLIYLNEELEEIANIINQLCIDYFHVLKLKKENYILD